MTENTNTAKGTEAEEEKKYGKFYELSRKVLLASVGAAAIAQEELSNYMDHLVERGEIAEKDARRLMNEMMEKREKIARERWEEHSHWHHAVVTREEVDALNERIDALNKRLDELKVQSSSEEKKTE